MLLESLNPKSRIILFWGFSINGIFIFLYKIVFIIGNLKISS